jgi:hypothetical protein
MSESLLLLFSWIKLIPYVVISVFGRELFLFPLANLMCSSRDLLSWVNVRLHDLTFNMEIKSKQSLNFKLKGVWISLLTQPHDIRFKVCGMFHMPFLSHETRDLGTEIKLRRTKLKENVCSIVHGTTICLKKNDNRKHVIWNWIGLRGYDASYVSYSLPIFPKKVKGTLMRSSVWPSVCKNVCPHW